MSSERVVPAASAAAGGDSTDPAVIPLPAQVVEDQARREGRILKIENFLDEYRVRAKEVFDSKQELFPSRKEKREFGKAIKNLRERDIEEVENIGATIIAVDTARWLATRESTDEYLRRVEAYSKHDYVLPKRVAAAEKPGPRSSKPQAVPLEEDPDLIAAQSSQTTGDGARKKSKEPASVVKDYLMMDRKRNVMAVYWETPDGTQEVKLGLDFAMIEELTGMDSFSLKRILPNRKGELFLALKTQSARLQEILTSLLRQKNLEEAEKAVQGSPKKVPRKRKSASKAPKKRLVPELKNPEAKWPEYVGPGKEESEILMYQQTRPSDLLIPQAAFANLVRFTLQKVARERLTRNQRLLLPEDEAPANTKFIQASAVLALQEASENFLIEYLGRGYMCAAHAGRSTLMPADLDILNRLGFHPDDMKKVLLNPSGLDIEGMVQEELE